MDFQNGAAGFVGFLAAFFVFSAGIPAGPALDAVAATSDGDNLGVVQEAVEDGFAEAYQ